MRHHALRLWDRIRGRKRFVAMDPGGTFTPDVIVSGYHKRDGTVVIEHIDTLEER